MRLKRRFVGIIVIAPVDSESLAPLKEWRKRMDEPTCRCHQNPFIGALVIQEPVILREPQIMKTSKRLARW